jgi:hypothetical protein
LHLSVEVGLWLLGMEERLGEQDGQQEQQVCEQGR